MSPTVPLASRQPQHRVILVGCVASKLPHRAPARELYTSTLFRMRRAYAERDGAPWRVFSAWYGLVLPEQEIEPYDVTFTDPDRNLWRKVVSVRVADALLRHGFTLVEIHSGAEYSADLVPLLRSAGIEVELPLAGLGIGEQLAWYRRRAELVRAEAFERHQGRLF